MKILANKDIRTLFCALMLVLCALLILTEGFMWLSYPLPSHRRARDSACGDTGDRHVLQQRHVLYRERGLQIHGAYAVRMFADAVIGKPLKKQ